MAKKVIFCFFVIIIFSLLEISLLGSLAFIKYFKPLALFIIYLSVRNVKYYEFLAIFAGFFLDINSSSAFGAHAAAMLLMAIISNYAYQNVFANNHLFSMAVLVAAGLAAYALSSSAISAVLHYLKISGQPGWSGNGTIEILYKEIVAAWALIAAYYLFKLLKNRAYGR